jgi:hypothetical protein
VAWLDDRVWCHPKLADLTDRSFRVWVNGMAYSSGFGTRGLLTPGQQRTIGADTRVRRELVAAGLWDETTEGVLIHDWDDHNGKRDARRAADRERKRAARSNGTSAGTSAGQKCVDGSEGSEGSDISPKAVMGVRAERPPERTRELRSVQ